MLRSTALLIAMMAWTTAAAQAGAQGAVPQPFPGSKTAPPASKQPPPAQPPRPATPAPAPAQPPAATTPAAPADGALTGIPLFPQGQFLDSYDAGQGQRYYLYGTNAAFDTVAAHFRTTLMTGGRQLYRTPAIHQFDLGRFDDERMAFPPSVVIKDYSTAANGGYLFVRDGTEQRFRTIIQIVPAAPPAR